MSDISFINVALDKIIDFSKCKTNGSFFTKTLINTNKGNIPVYGASKDENEVSYGYVQDNLVIKGKNGKNNTVKYFENCLTWNIDGSIAVFYRKERFSLSEKVIPLIVYEELKENIDLEYLKICISQSKEINNFGFSNKAGKSKLKEIKISIPIKNVGTYDLEVQQEIVQKFNVLMEKQNKLLDNKRRIETSLVEADFASDYNHTEVLITDLFVPCNGAMKYTKKYCNSNKGEFPIYSGNTRTEFAFINSHDYDGKYLTWCIDGFAGYMNVLDGEFSITNHRGILIPKETTDIDNLDMDYLKYVLEPIFRKSIKGRRGHDGQNEYTSLKLNAVNKIKQKISIPIMKDGTFDLKLQQEIAKKYKKIEDIRIDISHKIQQLIDVNIPLVS